MQPSVIIDVANIFAGLMILKNQKVNLYPELPVVHKIASLKKIRHYKSKSNIFMKIHIIINVDSKSWKGWSIKNSCSVV